MKQLEYIVTVQGEIPRDIAVRISRAHADAVQIHENARVPDSKPKTPVLAQGDSHE